MHADGAMNVTEAIFSRRSVRTYSPRIVEEAAVRQLLRSAVQAPSAINVQPWLFAVVQNVAQLKRYSDRAKAQLLARYVDEPKSRRYADLMRERTFNIFYDAGTLVAIGVKEPGVYAEADCWLAAQNLMLAACDLGLGTCCIGFAIPVLNSLEAKIELGFPAGGAVVAPVIVGYPTAVPGPVPRTDPVIASWSR